MITHKTFNGILCALIIILIFFPFLSLNMYADSEEEIRAEIEKLIPEQVIDYYNVDTTHIIAPSFSDILRYLSESVLARIYSPLRTLSSLMIIIVISAVFHLCSGFINNEAMKRAFEFACIVSITLSLLSSSNSVLNEARNYLDRLSDFSLTLAPVLTGICIASGNAGSAAVTGTGISVFVAACEGVFSSILFPMISASLAFSVCSCMSDDTPNLSVVVSFIKRIFSLLMGFVLMLYCAVVAYQSLISTSADSLSLRTVRFAVGNAVPVVGASLGEAVRTVSGALSSLKSTVGGIGISVILLLLLPCIITLILERIALYTAQVICGIFGLKRESRLLEGILSVYGYATVLAVCASVMLIFMLSMVSFVAVNIGGI